MSQANGTDLYTKQCELELEGIKSGEAKYWKYRQELLSNKNKDNSMLSPEQHLMQQLIAPTTEHLTTRLAGPLCRQNGLPKKAHDFLSQEVGLSPVHLAFLAARALINKGMDESLQATALNLGSQVIDDHEYMLMLAEAPAYITKVEEGLRTKHLTHRRKVLSHTKSYLKTADGVLVVTKVLAGKDLKFYIGLELLEAVCTATGFFQIKEVVSQWGKSRVKLADRWIQAPFKNIMPIPKVAELLEGWAQQLAQFSVDLWPMVFPPNPWCDLQGGGFLTRRGALNLRLINTRQSREHMEAASAGDLTKLYKAINAIQDTPFRINKRILAVVEWAAERGRAKLPMPDQADILAEAKPKPWTSDEEFILWRDTRRNEFMDIMSSHAACYDKWARENSKRTALLNKLWIANKFKDYEELWFVHNLDFRGREYPKQGFINPQLDDPGKGVLEFAWGKRLGTEGVRSLLINIANAYGYDKASYEDRIQWVQDHHGVILACAEDPYLNSFWEDADAPFCFLAACFDYEGYVREGEDHISRLVCSADGTCSGVQHYAAMLRDEEAAPKVNLRPGDKPSDLYDIIAKEVTRNLEAGFPEEEDQEMANLWLGIGVGRAETKRNSMTLAYGLTKRGFRLQMEEHVRKHVFIDGPKGKFTVFSSNLKRIRPAAWWLGDRNAEALASALPKPKQAMDYIQKLAGWFGRHNMAFHWTTPIGLRVLHLYNKTKKVRLNSQVGGFNLKLTLQTYTDQQDPARHRNASAPNFIHSLDASHLMFTTLKCEESKGADGTPMAYAFIHDSFGCHAADLHIMQKNLREAFMEMYSVNILEGYVNELTAQVPEHLRDKWDELLQDNPMPTMGTEDINEVVDSPYLFN